MPARRTSRNAGPVPKLTRYPLLLLALTSACGDSPTAPVRPDPSPADVAALHVASVPTSARLGRQLASFPVIELRDAAGQRVALSGVAVTASISSGSLTGKTVVSTDAQGRAVFRDLVVDGDPGTVELAFQCCELAPAASPLALSLADPTILRVGTAQMAGRAGYPLSQPVQVRARDGRDQPLAGAAVRFRVDDPARPVDTTVVSDESGFAALSYRVRDLPGGYQLTAELVSTGQTLKYWIHATASGAWTVEGDDPASRVADPGATVTLPSLRLGTAAGGPDGAHVLYRIVEGAGVLSHDTVLTAGGVPDPVTLTAGGRGVTSVEIFAPGYMNAPWRFNVISVTGPVTFALPDPCDGCLPLTFSWYNSAAAILTVQVRDAVGPLGEYPVQIEYLETAGLVYVEDGFWGYEIPSGGWVETWGNGLAEFVWYIPQASGSYAVRMSGPRIAEPWTFTATRH